MQNNNGTEKKRKRCSFTAAEKVRLAGQVQQKPCIWDLSHPKHFNINTLSSAWADISAAMEKSVEECKSNWAALRDGRRYRMKLAVKRKNGDASGSPIPKEESFDDDWEFGKAMQFLPDNSKKRNFNDDWEFGKPMQFSPDNIKKRDSSGDDPIELVLVQGASETKYTYKEHQSSTPFVDHLNVENLNALIEFQLQRNNNKRVRSKDRERIQPLKYQTLYAHMDTMLSRLPQEKVDRVSNKILSFITEELIKKE